MTVLKQWSCNIKLTSLFRTFDMTGNRLIVGLFRGLWLTSVSMFNVDYKRNRCATVAILARRFYESANFNCTAWINALTVTKQTCPIRLHRMNAISSWSIYILLQCIESLDEHHSYENHSFGFIIFKAVAVSQVSHLSPPHPTVSLVGGRQLKIVKICRLQHTIHKFEFSYSMRILRLFIIWKRCFCLLLLFPIS
jgi:hypothetical protein